MKRTILLVAGLATLALAYFGSRLLAQAPAAAPAAPGTRVAVINIATVFDEYKKATTFKQELLQTAQPYKAELERLQKEMYQLQTDGTKPGANKAQIDDQVVQLTRKFEDKKREVANLYKAKGDAQMVQLWREINEVVTRVAKTNSFNIVLAYGDPPDSDPSGANVMVSIRRKFQAMDVGSTTLIYSDVSVNITNVVVETLNRSYAGSVPAQPTSNPTPR